MDNAERQKFMRKQSKENKKNKKAGAGRNDMMEDGVSIVRKGFGRFVEVKGENRRLQFKRNCEVCASISFSNNDHNLHSILDCPLSVTFNT
jgi:hypothetical protein